MISKKRIITMTKLAVYDQKYGPRDKKDNEYYRHDYIYRKNMWTRLCAAAGAVIILAVYWMYQLFALKRNFLEIDYQRACIDAGVFILAVMAIYTIIGTIRETAVYAKGQKRLKNYMRMLYALDRVREPETGHNTVTVHTKEESNLYYGADIASKRNNNTVV
ncbi:MAG: hypothetical protein LBS84_01100 [Clostridiales bacterium]|nr:hypothetical protein [Clostridiales bacterium]